MPNKPECQQKGFELKHFLHLWPLQRLGDLVIRVLSWSSFSERGAVSSWQATHNLQQGEQEQQKRGEDAGWGRGRGQLGGSLVS